MQYARDAMVTSQLLGMLPKFLKWPVGMLMMRRTGACRRLYQIIRNEVERRISSKGRSSPGADQTKHVYTLPPHDRWTIATNLPSQLDCLQWMADALKTKDDPTIHQICQRAIGMIFAGMFQPEMVSGTGGERSAVVVVQVN